jgi:ATP-dependent DNA ligase
VGVKVDICTGLELPFYPMRPIKGRVLQRAENIKQLYYQTVEEHHWVMQPKLNGDRACLAVVDGKVYVQNRHGGCYRMKVANAPDFLKLPNRTCFDGEVFKRNFYPFELLACNAMSFLRAEAQERVRLAKDMTRFIGHPWLFETPSLPWLLRRAANLPTFEGVVLKATSSRYIMLGSDTQFSQDWMKRRWH